MPSGTTSRLTANVIGGQGRLLLTIRETCALLSLSRRSVERAIDAGDFQIVRVGPTGRHVRVTQTSIDRYIKDRLQKVPA